MFWEWVLSSSAVSKADAVVDEPEGDDGEIVELVVGLVDHGPDTPGCRSESHCGNDMEKDFSAWGEDGDEHGEEENCEADEREREEMGDWLCGV